jgi:hypothetical protein
MLGGVVLEQMVEQVLLVVFFSKLAFVVLVTALVMSAQLQVGVLVVVMQHGIVLVYMEDQHRDNVQLMYVLVLPQIHVSMVRFLILAMALVLTTGTAVLFIVDRTLLVVVRSLL